MEATNLYSLLQELLRKLYLPELMDSYGCLGHPHPLLEKGVCEVEDP
jgi:hypothetical protein